MIKTGIYKIESLSNPDKIYIGSAVNIKSRWGTHLSDLRKNKHDNKRIQNHCNKYGINDLQFSIIIECNKEDLIKQEQYYIDTLNPFFNICKTAGITLGVKHSEEQKIKWRLERKGTRPCRLCVEKSIESHKGVRMPEYVKEKIRVSHIGLGHTEETKKLLSTIRTGKKLSEEHRRKIALGGIGRKPTEETRKKLSASNMGHFVSHETRRKISEANKGKPSKMKGMPSPFKGIKRSDETRRKISQGRLGIIPWNKGMKYTIERKAS